jgi:hypothetical protein
MRPLAGLRGTAMMTKGGSVEADLAEGLADVEAAGHAACYHLVNDEAASITGLLRQLLPAAV